MRLIRILREKLTTLKLVNEPKWHSVYQSIEEYSVHIRKLKLESEGIPTMVFDQRDSSYNAFGYIYLQVPLDHVEEANKILKEFDE